MKINTKVVLPLLNITAAVIGLVSDSVKDKREHDEMRNFVAKEVSKQVEERIEDLVKRGKIKFN